MLTWRDKKPIEGQPAGLIAWFAPGERPVVLTTFWVALIGGGFPRLRASWPGRRDPRSLFWPGGDFVFHFLSDENLREVGRLAGSGRLCFDAESDLGLIAHPAAFVKAPLFKRLPAMVECRNGTIVSDVAEPEIKAEIVRLYCGGRDIEIVDDVDLDVLNLLRCFSRGTWPEDS